VEKGIDYRKYRVLVVDDEVENLQAFLLNFRSEFTIETADSGAAALSMLRQRDFALIISDQRMPRMSGVDLLEKTVASHPHLIRIIITGYTDNESLISAINQGRIHRYITKPWKPDELQITLKRAIERFALDAHNRQLVAELRREKAELKRMVQEQTQQLRRANDRLRKLAISDGLTGLYNHRYFQDRWRREVQLARRYGESLSLMILDVDNFKNYNDTMGHPQGDVLLKEMAMLLLRSVREVDLVARYGGEEFVVVLPKSKPDAALVLAERVRSLVGQHPFPHRDIQPGGRLTVSIGVSSFPHDGADAGQIIVAADKALYRAKRAGRDKVEAASRTAAEEDAIAMEAEQQDLDLVIDEDGSVREAALSATDLPQASGIDSFSIAALQSKSEASESEEEIIAITVDEAGSILEPPGPLDRSGPASESELIIIDVDESYD
jgi:diguanylate cyclase (GGDEF)-like protein